MDLGGLRSMVGGRWSASRMARSDDMSDLEKIDELVRAIRASTKYGSISEDLVRAIGRRELAARRGLKDAVKATKNKLHQVAGAYLDTRPRYDAWAAELADAAQADRRPPLRHGSGQATTDHRQPTTGDSSQTTDHGLRTTDYGLRTTDFRQTCLRIMRHHASTDERIPILDTFYAATLARVGPVRSVLDVACGINPLAMPWMPLADNAEYYACDLYADMVAFLNRFFEIAGVRGQAQVCDLISAPPRRPVHVALVLKALPPLEQVDKNAGINLLRALDAEYLLVSFPAHSLGGRARGMVENYEQHFRALIQAEGWSVERFVFPSELAFLVTK
jgi:16S rRNA (guanine(1405)-N(7))-methyltransferase